MAAHAYVGWFTGEGCGRSKAAEGASAYGGGKEVWGMMGCKNRGEGWCGH